MLKMQLTLFFVVATISALVPILNFFPLGKSNTYKRNLRYSFPFLVSIFLISITVLLIYSFGHVYYMYSPIPTTERFEENVSDYLNGKIKYSSPEYGIDVILPYGCLCKNYSLSSRQSQENIELQFDSDLRIDITIGQMPYGEFYSLEEYSNYYFDTYNQFPNFYKSYNFEESIPYCVFSFNTDNGQGIYYELIYNLNGIYCVTKFSYPTSKHSVYNEVVSDYVKDAIFA